MSPYVACSFHEDIEMQYVAKTKEVENNIFHVVGISREMLKDSFPGS